MRKAAIMVLTIGISSSVAFGLDSSQTRCRKFLASRTQGLAETTTYQELACHKQRMLGTLAATVDCNDPDSAQFPTERLSRIAGKVTSFVSHVSKYCSSTPSQLGFTLCASPCNTEVPALTTMEDVATCLGCLAKHEASTAVATDFGSNPPITTTRTDPWQCQNSDLGSGTYSYGRTRMNQQRACQYKEDSGRIGATDCRSADLNGKIATAASRLATKIDKCSDSDLGALTSCAATVSGAQTCVRNAVETLTDTLFDQIYPTIPPTPTFTPTNTPTTTYTPPATQTPTLTSTPKATATATPTTAAGSCASANFLDVTGAAGPGSGYPTPSLSVSCNGSTVTVHSNGIPTYKYIAMTPNGLQAKSYTFNFPQTPAVAASTTNVPLLGNIGVAVNGIPIYGVNEGPQPTSDAYGDPIAAAILDECGSHSAQQGTFHNHELFVKCLIQSAVSSSQPWNNADPSPSDPSPIVGYAFDGFPIYGPYECTDAGCSSVQEMLSAWDNTGYQAGTVGCTSSAACSSGYCTEVMISGTQTTACVPKTCVWSNNHYTAKSGANYLDQCNGHIGPNGDYHYHTTSTFPYILGCYRGTATNNGGSGTPPGGTCS